MSKIRERKERQREERRQNILLSAKRIARNEGWVSVSIRRIADDILYSTPVIYGHFESKEAILQELAQEGFSILQQFMQEAKRESNQPAEQLLAVSLAHLRFVTKFPEMYQLMFGLGGVACKSEADHASCGGPTIVFEIFDQLKSGETSTFELFDHWWCLMHGFISLRMQNGNTLPEDSFPELKRYVGRFIRSL
jgi:AcrR family transcriptional regulator